MKLSAKLPPDDEGGRAGMRYPIRQRLSTADDYVSAWLQDAVSCGGGT